MNAKMQEIAEKLKNDTELKEKFIAELKRVADSGEAANAGDAFTKAVKTVLGIELAPEDVGDALNRELTPDELGNVAGGSWDDFWTGVKTVLAIVGVPIPVKGPSF